MSVLMSAEFSCCEKLESIPLINERKHVHRPMNFDLPGLECSQLHLNSSRKTCCSHDWHHILLFSDKKMGLILIIVFYNGTLINHHWIYCYAIWQHLPDRCICVWNPALHRISAWNFISYGITFGHSLTNTREWCRFWYHTILFKPLVVNARPLGTLLLEAAVVLLLLYVYTIMLWLSSRRRLILRYQPISLRLNVHMRWAHCMISAGLLPRGPPLVIGREKIGLLGHFFCLQR